MPLFPETPIPSVVFPGSIEWPAIEAQFDSVYRQVRQLTNRGLRTIELEYPFLRIDELDTLLLFYNKRKGKAERFDVKVPIESLVDPGFESGDLTNIWSPDDANATISSTPGDPRSGLRCGKITVPATPAEKRLTGIQKFPLFAGDAVYLSGYAKASASTGAVGTIFIELFDASDVFVAGGPSPGDVTLTTSYVLYNAAQFPTTVPANVYSGAIKVRCTAASTAGRVLFFDDLSVRLQFPVRFADKIEWRQRPDAFDRYACTVRLIESP